MLVNEGTHQIRNHCRCRLPIRLIKVKLTILIYGYWAASKLSCFSAFILLLRNNLLMVKLSRSDKDAVRVSSSGMQIDWFHMACLFISFFCISSIYSASLVFALIDWVKVIFYKKRKFIIITIIIIIIIIINIVVTANSCMFRQVILNMF